MTTTVSPISPRSGDDLTSHDGPAVSLRERALAGESAWSREARIALALAAEAGVAMDDETLFACDVRDLQTLQHSLQHTIRRSSAHRCAGCHRHRPV
jgi:hypothetical protein